MTTLKQFNFKIPQDLYDQLNAAASAKGVKMTELVIQGIRQVLNITARSSGFGADLDIYELIDQLSLRLDKLEQSQTDIAQSIYQYIPRLEKQLKNNGLDTGIADDIAKTVYAQIERDINQLVLQSIAQNIAIDISKDSKNQTLAVELPQEVIPLFAEYEVKPDTNSIETSEVSESNTELLKDIQIEIPGIADADGKDIIFDNAQKVNSVKLLQVLKEQDPKGEWNNEKLTNYRRYKKFKNRWHIVGSYQFKYADEISEDKVLGTSKHLHVWWLTKKEIAE